MERRRIQVSSPLRQVRVAATNIMPGRRVTANDIVYTFFLFDTDVQRHMVFPLSILSRLSPLYPLTSLSILSFPSLCCDFALYAPSSLAQSLFCEHSVLPTYSLFLARYSFFPRVSNSLVTSLHTRICCGTQT